MSIVITEQVASCSEVKLEVWDISRQRSLAPRLPRSHPLPVSVNIKKRQGLSLYLTPLRWISRKHIPCVRNPAEHCLTVSTPTHTHTWPTVGTGLWSLSQAATCSVPMACITQDFQWWDVYSCMFKSDVCSGLGLGGATPVMCRSCSSSEHRFALWLCACRPTCSASRVSTARQTDNPALPPPTPTLGLAPPAVECIRPQNGSSAAAVAHGERSLTDWAAAGLKRGKVTLRMKFSTSTC